jgi:transcriptional regulator with XRE-family HTH domain
MTPTDALSKPSLKRGDQRRIAKRLGVAPSLVSLVKQGKAPFENETTERIRKAIEKRLEELAGHAA